MLIIAPIQYLVWGKIRIIRYREDIFEQRDDLFDFAAKKGWVWDAAFIEAYEHLGHLTQIIEFLSVRLIATLTTQMGVPKTRKMAADPDLQKFIDETYARSALRTWEYLIGESLWCKVLRLVMPVLIRCLRGVSWSLDLLQKRKLEKETVERFVRSEAPVEMSLKVKPSSPARALLKETLNTTGHLG